MAVRNHTINHKYPGVVVIEWAGLLNTDSGQPLELPDLADKSIQVVGTPGAGFALVLEGSNDPGASPVYGTLNDANGSALTFSAVGVDSVLENTLLIRPRVTGGDGTTNVTVRLCARTGLQGRYF